MLRSPPIKDGLESKPESRWGLGLDFLIFVFDLLGALLLPGVLMISEILGRALLFFYKDGNFVEPLFETSLSWTRVPLNIRTNCLFIPSGLTGEVGLNGVKGVVGT